MSRARRVHTDAVQWFGKEAVTSIHQFNADLVSICAHKIHGPKGVGALYIRSALRPDPLLFGGAHENERRAGTENLPGIVALAECLEHFVRQPVFPERLKDLTARLLGAVEGIDGCHFVGSRHYRLTNTVSFVVEGSDSITLLAGLDMEGRLCFERFCVFGRIVAAVTRGKAIGWATPLANALVRFSLGRESTEAEVQFVVATLPEVVRRAQRRQ